MEMNASTTREALDLLLEGYRFSPETLEAFILRFQEDQYLDYKDGSITTREKRGQARITIREYVTGFANGDGGILVLGVTDRSPREISPCSWIGNETLDRWAESLLLDIAPRFSPPPRIHVVEHSKGPVLIIAVARAGELVPCVESRQLKYFLRVNQSTIEAPAYLISDLVLGRRQHPIVELTVSVEQPPPYAKSEEAGIGITFSAQNVSLVTAEQLALGLVTWVVGPRVQDINPHLLAYIDLSDPQVHHVDWGLRHHTVQARAPEITRLSAFSRVRFESIPGLVYSFTETKVEIVAAVYLLSKGSPPQWYELTFRCGRLFEGAPVSSRGIVSECRVSRVISKRPRVICGFVD